MTPDQFDHHYDRLRWAEERADLKRARRHAYRAFLATLAVLAGALIVLAVAGCAAPHDSRVNRYWQNPGMDLDAARETVRRLEDR